MPVGNPGGYGGHIRSMAGAGPRRPLAPPTAMGPMHGPARPGTSGHIRAMAGAGPARRPLAPPTAMGPMHGPLRPPAAMGPMHGPLRPPTAMGPMHGPARPGPVATAARQADNAGKKALLKGKGKGLAIGAGAAVIAGLAYSGRRGEGSSGGRTGMTRY